MHLLTLVLAVIQPLWPECRIPDYQSEQVAALKTEIVRKDFDRAAHQMPYLDWYEAPTNANGAVIVIIPGGGYAFVSEGPTWQQLADGYRAAGITCVKLVYRTPRPKGLPIHQSAWEDGQRAIRLVRAAAAEKGLDPERIGVLGVSAGANLSVILATSSQTNVYAKVDATDELPCHVNWAIPISVAYALTDGLADRNARAGDAPDVKLNSVFAFDAKTAPMCFFHGGIDPYSPNGSTQLYRQLRRMKIPAELHLAPDRGHTTDVDEVLGRSLEFLRQLGFLGSLAPEVDLMTRFSNDDARGGYEKQDVWPKGKMPNAQAHQCVPYIEWHLPKKLKTKAIQIIYSGGGYGGNSPDGFEVAPTRRYLNEKGMAVVTLKYRTPRPQGLQKHVTAWQDLQRTIRIVRSQAAKKGLDPDRIGIMGSSAGGHLTLMGATSSLHQSYNPIDKLDELSCSVRWALAVYPAYALTDGDDMPNKEGGNPDDARLVPEFSFDLSTCPVFFIHGDADGWAAMNSVKCWEQLRRMGIQSELHTLVTRGHCFHRKSAPGTASYNYNDRIWDFLTTKKFNR